MVHGLNKIVYQRGPRGAEIDARNNNDETPVYIYMYQSSRSL